MIEGYIPTLANIVIRCTSSNPRISAYRDCKVIFGENKQKIDFDKTKSRANINFRSRTIRRTNRDCQMENNVQNVC